MSSWRGIAPIGSKALKGTAAMRPFLRMVGEESPWLQPLWVFRAPPLRASDASPQRLAYSKKCSRFYIYLMLSKIYNLSDELASSTYSEWNGSGWTQKSTRTRTYDYKGRLVETREGNSMLASYTYSANGNVVSKHYYDAGTEVLAKTVRRTIL